MKHEARCYVFIAFLLFFTSQVSMDARVANHSNITGVLVRPVVQNIRQTRGWVKWPVFSSIQMYDGTSTRCSHPSYSHLLPWLLCRCTLLTENSCKWLMTQLHLFVNIFPLGRCICCYSFPLSHTAQHSTAQHSTTHRISCSCKAGSFASVPHEVQCVQMPTIVPS